MEDNRTEDLFALIQESPTAFHAVAALQHRLEEQGYQELVEWEDWELQPGGKYFVKRNRSSIICFVLPEGEIRGWHMAAAHTDSPAFRVKSSPELWTDDSYLKLNTEKYGGMILSTWLDRPLSLAGRVFVETENSSVEERLVNFDRDLLVIPNLAIHMNRDINQGFAYNPQVDMLPILSDEKGCSLRKLLSEELGVEEERILSEELYAYVRQKGCIIGEKGQWIMSPRLDDLQCIYAALQGLFGAEPKEYMPLCAFFDNEEVGSGTRQGADSDFLAQTLNGIGYALNIPEQRLGQLLQKSFLISADNAHALHPNHPEKADLTNRPKLNGGIVIKYHGGQKYTTDGYSGAMLVRLCKKAGVSYQTYCNRSDIAGGSTLGNISIAHVPVPSVDIGFAQLAMHSAVETAGREDVCQGIRLFETYFSE